MKPPKNAATGAPSAPSEGWRPNLRWHLKALGGIYLALVLVYAALTLFLSRVPPPYRLRDIPQEVTPWLKK